MGLVRKIFLLGAAAAVLWGAALPAFAVEATLVADAHVNSALPGVNSGAISNLNVGAGYTALLQFDLSTLPVGTTAGQVSRAVLRLYCNRVNTAGLVSVQPVGAAWGEYSVTFASLPSLGSAVQVASVSQVGAYVTVDVTALVQGWISAPTTNNGLALTAGTAAVQFDSKENDLTGHAAMLDVTLATSGPAGPIGLAGATGPTGPAGATGATGSAGVGTTGATGATGAAGPAGPMGLTGPAGVAGPAGSAGVAGATGATGSPGLVYQGAYSAVTNYAVGDVVLWQGASYASLVASNQGNMPSLSPLQWGVLTAQGPTGATGAQGVVGATGAQGLPGSVGPSGPAGPQGQQGISGQPGAQGLTGPAGAQGVAGPMGPQGVSGPVGMAFRGAYSATANYGVADGVLFGGAGYVSLVPNNIGNSPDVSPSQWAVFAMGTAGPAGTTGAMGPQGTTGAQGAQGVAGSQGEQGATGPQGPSVANYTGNYAATTNYGPDDAVSFGGSTYISLVAGNVGNTPSLSSVQWALLAAQGAMGPAGATGPAGPAGAAGATGVAGATGPQGPPVSFLGGWLAGTNYAVGSAVSYGGTSYVALTGNVGREPDVSPGFWGVLAQGGAAGTPGVAGAVGPQGPAGAVGINYRGAWASSVTYQPNDAASFGGTTYFATAGSSALEPDLFPGVWAVLAQAGGAGPTGPTGTAAAVSVGTVTTGAAGSSATVTNSGTGGAAVLNFTIPQGAPGTGGGGGGGTSGIPFASTYHSVSFNNTYYSVNSGNQSTSEVSSVLTWVPAGCIATNLNVFSQQSSTISVTLRQGTPTTMADTAMTCSVSPGSACLATGSVAVAAGNFVDLQVTGASGTAVGVWMALACN